MINSKMDIGFRILSLLNTMEEGLKHTEKQLSELRYEEAIVMLQDLMEAISSIEKSLEKIEGNRNTKSINFNGPLKESMSRAIAIYKSGKRQDLEGEIIQFFGPKFLDWKSDLEIKIRPSIMC